MAATISVLNSLESRMSQCIGQSGSGKPTYGWLVGSQFAQELVVTSILQRDRESGSGAELAHDAEEARNVLPFGLAIIGAFTTSHQTVSSQDEARELCRSCWTACVQHTKLADLPLVCAVVQADDVSWFQGSSPATIAAVNPKIASQADLPKMIVPDVAAADRQWISRNLSCLVLELSLELVLYGLEPQTSTASRGHGLQIVPLEAAADAAVAAAIEDTCGSAAVFLATAPASSDQLLLGHGQETSSHTIGTLSQQSGQAISITALCRSQAADGQGLHVQYQPVKGGSCSLTRTSFNLSVVCYVPQAMLLSQLPSQVIKPAVQQQAQAMKHKLVQGATGLPWTAFQVLPPGWPHLVTLMYPLPKTQAAAGGQTHSSHQQQEEALKPLRLKLHQRLGLPADRPLLRFANAVDPRAPQGGVQQGPPTGKAVRLQHVHHGIAAPAVEGGSMHVIEGDYDYHHYMQDKCDDAGWGCAYRSLQTIHSWMRHQHYTHLPAPSLQEIQQTLVDIGDKPQAFVGSREWIGAIELGYVLDTRLGLTCKVMTVASGAEMGSKARELAHHFDAQGTPVMIGGGVLAYTLLGVCHNEQTGECAFLILDPHYTGEENLAKIQSGQWVSWKAPNGKAAAGGPLFVQTAFYNLLCPQRPDVV